MIVVISLTSYSTLTEKAKGRAEKRRDAGQDCDNHDAESSLGGQQHNDWLVSWKLSPWWGHREAPAALGGRGSGPEIVWPLPEAASPLLHARHRGCGFLRLQALHERWLLENDVASDGVYEGDSRNGIQLRFLSEFPILHPNSSRRMNSLYRECVLHFSWCIRLPSVQNRSINQKLPGITFWNRGGNPSATEGTL